MHLYALYGLRGSVGVLRVQKCEYSHLIAFNFCTLKFCNHARTDQQDRHPDNCARIPYAGAWRKIRTPNRRSGISGICAICRRSAKDQRKRSARARTGPGIDRPRSADLWRSEKQALKLWNREISDQNLRKNFLVVVGIFRKHRGVQILPEPKIENRKFF